MSLKTYQSKRKFQLTPEPKGSTKGGRGPLRFVIQKHHASHLHYDLRLESGGTLKSWAVPKGLPVNTADKRLALMVEDHPLDYLHFEGVIPKGNYGAGTVMVWDEGTYHVPGITSRENCEKIIAEGLKKGRFHFVLHGRKLSAEFGLFRMKGGEENAWLLFKKTRGDARKAPTGQEDRSVLTDRTMEELTRNAAPRPSFPAGIDLSDAPKGAMPRNIKPMLATPAAKPFDHPSWVFEVKWDGYRAIAEIEKNRVRLYSRNNLSFENRFAPIVESLQYLGHDAILDGEVVVLDENGKPRFELLQHYQKGGKGTLIYQVFDVLYLDGHVLRNLPLVRRKQILARLLDHLPNVNFSEEFKHQGVAFFKAVSDSGLEGVVAKDERSRYQEGRRSRSWLKIKTHLRQEAVIGGFTEPKGSRKGLGALALGVYDNGDLIYIGHAGTGFTGETAADLRSKLEDLIQKGCPFKKRPKSNAPAHWVEPRLLCEVSFAAWTPDGHMRHPVFLGLREDKNASAVRRERPLSANADLSTDKEKQRPALRTTQPEDQPNRQETIDAHDVKLTNLQKVYWPDEGYTKGDLIRYYREVASFILPHLKDRPQSLHRHPNGVDGESFFQKDVRKQPPPEWVQTVDITPGSDGKKVRTLLCQDEATLAYLANLGCIELNPWTARVGSLDRPDYSLLDLDPEDISFEHVIETAQMIRKVLHEVGAESVCKTSGKRGLHVYVPFGARYSHEQARQFAELIATIVHAKLPSLTSMVRHPSERQGKIYLDCLQNGKGKTLAAPYSARPYAKATVSTPLKWPEVRRGLDPTRFTINTMAKRLNLVGDLWAPVLGPGIDLPACLERLASLVKKETS